MRLCSTRTQKKLGAVGIGVIAATLAVSAVSAANPSPPFIPATSDWLTTVNYYRAMAGVGPVVEDTAMSAGAALHSCYMLYNGIAHDEVPGLQGYTAEGDATGNSGNVAVSSVIGTSARSHIELWMSGPFHAIGVLRPNLQSTGFGKCDMASTPAWHSGATLDVIRGLGSAPRPTQPILFPGNGTTTNLDRFVVESPDPLSFCGWSGPAGLPIIAMMPEAPTGPTATLNGPNGPIEVCVLSGKAILQGDNAVVVVPRTPLAPGQYGVNVSTAARSVSWGFAVDPAAVNGVSPVPTAQPAATANGFEPLTPARIVDTRVPQGTSRLNAQLSRRIQVTGQGGVPAQRCRR
jgi:Cysteine-rich secretory protein family